MKMSLKSTVKVGITLALLIFLTLPAIASDSVIFSGVDLWKTPGDGSTYSDFSKEPIPPDFFCPGSKAFTGRIVFAGAELATSPAKALGNTDTIVQRLTDATFDGFGVARTPIQLKALAFNSLAPVKTSCGNFDVKVSLAGKQPITEMLIVKTRDEGGFFLSPIHVVVKMSFLPENASGKVVELERELKFAPSGKALWSSQPGSGGIQQKSTVYVDSNGDGDADLWVPGTSNFAAGWGVPAGKATIGNEIGFDDGNEGYVNIGGIIYPCDNPPDCNHRHGTTPADDQFIARN